MSYFFIWVQLTAICYLASAILSPPALFGSAILPWWSWGFLIAFSYLHNNLHLNRKSNGLIYGISNLMFFLTFGVGGLGFLQKNLSGSFWPNSFMNILVGFILILCIAVSFYRPPTDKLRIQLWELGIIVSSYGAFLASGYLNMPYIYIVPLLVIATGILRQSLSETEESKEVIRDSQSSHLSSIWKILFLLTAGITGLSLVGFVSNNSIGQAINSLIRKIIEYYNQVGQEPLNKPTRFMPFLKYDSTGLMESTSSYGATAPLWFMIILWIILGITLILLLICGVIVLKDFIQSIRSTSLQPQTRKTGTRNSIYLAFRKLLKQIPKGLFFCISKLKQGLLVIIFHMGISPRDVKGLFTYFIWWGSCFGIKRKKSQTLREFQEGLTRLMPQSNSDLVSSIKRLTDSYECYYYGGNPEPLSKQEIKEVHKILEKYRQVILKVT